MPIPTLSLVQGHPQPERKSTLNSQTLSPSKVFRSGGFAAATGVSNLSGPGDISTATLVEGASSSISGIDEDSPISPSIDGAMRDQSCSYAQDILRDLRILLVVISIAQKVSKSYKDGAEDRKRCGGYGVEL